MPPKKDRQCTLCGRPCRGHIGPTGQKCMMDSVMYTNIDGAIENFYGQYSNTNVTPTSEPSTNSVKNAVPKPPVSKPPANVSTSIPVSFPVSESYNYELFPEENEFSAYDNAPPNPVTDSFGDPVNLYTTRPEKIFPEDFQTPFIDRWTRDNAQMPAGLPAHTNIVSSYGLPIMSCGLPSMIANRHSVPVHIHSQPVTRVNFQDTISSNTYVSRQPMAYPFSVPNSSTVSSSSRPDNAIAGTNAGANCSEPSKVVVSDTSPMVDEIMTQLAALRSEVQRLSLNNNGSQVTSDNKQRRRQTNHTRHSRRKHASSSTTDMSDDESSSSSFSSYSSVHRSRSKSKHKKDIILSNGAHISAYIEERAQKGYFADLNDFMPYASLAHALMDRHTKSKHNNRHNLNSISNYYSWVTAFSGYTECVLESDPTLWREFESHRLAIMDLDARYNWNTVFSYDLQFRANMAKERVFTFKCIDSALHCKIFSPDQLRTEPKVCFRCHNTLHFSKDCPFREAPSVEKKAQESIGQIQNNQSNFARGRGRGSYYGGSYFGGRRTNERFPSSRFNSQSRAPSFEICRAWNQNFCKFGTECFRKHVCENCGGPYPRYKCNACNNSPNWGYIPPMVSRPQTPTNSYSAAQPTHSFPPPQTGVGSLYGNASR